MGLLVFGDLFPERGWYRGPDKAQGRCALSLVAEKNWNMILRQ